MQTVSQRDAPNSKASSKKRKKSKKAGAAGGGDPSSPPAPYKKRNPILLSTENIPCTFYLHGRCEKGDACLYAHVGVQHTKKELCRFYTSQRCIQGDKCPYSHDTSKFPCMYFHGFVSSRMGQCREGDACKYSHKPLTPEGKAWLEKVTSRDPLARKKGGTANVSQPSSNKPPHVNGAPQRWGPPGIVLDTLSDVCVTAERDWLREAESKPLFGDMPWPSLATGAGSEKACSGNVAAAAPARHEDCRDGTASKGTAPAGAESAGHDRATVIEPSAGTSADEAYAALCGDACASAPPSAQELCSLEEGSAEEGEVPCTDASAEMSGEPARTLPKDGVPKGPLAQPQRSHTRLTEPRAPITIHELWQEVASSLLLAVVTGVSRARGKGSRLDHGTNPVTIILSVRFRHYLIKKARTVASILECTDRARMSAFGAGRAAAPIPPEKGVFPLDHFGECKKEMYEYMKCLNAHNQDASRCRPESKRYLECRMEKNLMARQDLKELGYDDDEVPLKKSNDSAKDEAPKEKPAVKKAQEGFVAGLPRKKD
eukprot:jgi/Mesvir1/68/Mv13672-RA.1